MCVNSLTKIDCLFLFRARIKRDNKHKQLNEIWGSCQLKNVISLSTEKVGKRKKKKEGELEINNTNNNTHTAEEIEINTN